MSNNINSKSFFAGQEEIFGRLLGCLITLVFFLIFILAKESITLKWQELTFTLLIFWFVYEFLSLVFYQMFYFFGKKDDSFKADDKINKDNKDINIKNNELSNIKPSSQDTLKL
jgi:hypothetical protein